jgi:hypothetical protein
MAYTVMSVDAEPTMERNRMQARGTLRTDAASTREVLPN